MPVLSICLFGVVRVYRESGPALPLARTSQALLAYLCLFRDRLHAREALRAVFWSGRHEDQARPCLNTALWRLRCLLEPPGVRRGTYVTTAPGGEVGFNADSDHRIDVDRFERAIGDARAWRAGPPSQRCLAALRGAIEVYRGDLLEDFAAEWVRAERARLRAAYLGAAAALMRYHADRAEWEEAAGLGRRILELEPLREQMHQEVIRLYARSGRRALAVRQFEICRTLLARELGVTPMPETIALWRDVVATPSVA